MVFFATADAVRYVIAAVAVNDLPCLVVFRIYTYAYLGSLTRFVDQAFDRDDHKHACIATKKAKTT